MVKTAFIQGRPDAHPSHKRFANAVQAEFHYVDFRMRWQDVDRSIFYRVVSWFVCAFTFPNKSKYHIFFVDNLHFMPVIMKSLWLIKRRQKIVAHLGSHTLYFIYAHRFSKFTEWLHIQALRRYDALICEGKMAEDLVKKILGTRTPKLYTIFNGVRQENILMDYSHTKSFKNKNILFVGHGTGEERMWYKGLDLMIEAFVIAWKKDPEISFTIVGEWDNSVQARLLSDLDKDIQSAIDFKEETPQLEKYFSNASLYLHCARGEAFGLTILLALAYGVPSIISEWTGAKEVINKIDQRMIVELDAEKIASQILWFVSLTENEKIALSEKGKKIVEFYTEENAIKCFVSKFEEMQKDFKLI